MIPNISVVNTALEEIKIPSNTHKIIIDKDRVSGHVDGVESVKQSIYLILSTERYAYPIYSWNYGVEVADLIGQPISYVIPELKRRIPEALLQDDRILSVDNFEFKLDKKKLHVKFVCTCEYGNIQVEKEVNI